MYLYLQLVLTVACYAAAQPQYLAAYPYALGTPLTYTYTPQVKPPSPVATYTPQIQTPLLYRYLFKCNFTVMLKICNVKL